MTEHEQSMADAELRWCSCVRPLSISWTDLPPDRIKPHGWNVSAMKNCPKCGGHGVVAVKESYPKTYLQEDTSKLLKSQIILCFIFSTLNIVGGSLIAAAEYLANGTWYSIWFFVPFQMCVALWYLITRFRIWWHHG